MKEKDIIFHQIFILFLVAMTIITFFYIKKNVSNDIPKDYRADFEVLSWNGSDLTLAKNSKNSGDEFSFEIIPAHLRPLFFMKIPVNNADFELLLTVPGIGPKLANEIALTLEEIGRFEKDTDLMLVPGIGRKKMNTFKQYLTYK